MGQQLLGYYEKAKALGGMKAQMRMAMITKVPSGQAGTTADSPETVALFEQAIKELQKEFN
jgi:peptidyl-tRNA hydrolase